MIDSTVNNMHKRAQARNLLASTMVPGMRDNFFVECKQLDQALACEEYLTHLLMGKLNSICNILLDKSNLMPHNKLRIHVFNQFQHLNQKISNTDRSHYVYQPPPTVTLHINIYLIDSSLIQQPIKRAIGSLFRTILIRNDKFTSLWMNPRGVSSCKPFHKRIDPSSSPFIPNSNCTFYEMKNDTIGVELCLIYECDTDIEITLFPQDRTPIVKYHKGLLEFFANLGVDISCKGIPEVAGLITDYALKNNLMNITDQTIKLNEPLSRVFSSDIKLKQLPQTLKNFTTSVAKTPIIIEHRIKASGTVAQNESYFDLDLDYAGQTLVFPWKPINVSAALSSLGTKFSETLSKLDAKECELSSKQFTLITTLRDKIHSLHLYRTFVNSQEEFFINLMGKNQLDPSKPLKSDKEIGYKSFSPTSPSTFHKVIQHIIQPWVYRAVHEYLVNRNKPLSYLIE